MTVGGWREGHRRRPLTLQKVGEEKQNLSSRDQSLTKTKFSQPKSLLRGKYFSDLTIYTGQVLTWELASIPK